MHEGSLRNFQKDDLLDSVPDFPQGVWNRNQLLYLYFLLANLNMLLPQKQTWRRWDKDIDGQL